MRTDRMFKVNQKVWSTSFGWGFIEKINTKDLSTPIRVLFTLVEGDKLYSMKGVRYNEALRTLFHEEIPIPESALNPPWEPIKGEWIAVSNDQHNWIIKQFVKISEINKIICTTTDQYFRSWNYAKPLSDFIKENENNG